MKRVYLIISLLCLFLLTACSSNTDTQPVQKQEQIPEKQYSILENEDKYFFPISTVTVNTTSDMWNYNIFDDFNLLLDTHEEITHFPYLYDNITPLNTAPKVYIIPRHYQQQYKITNVSLKDGVITIKYTTENNAKIDRLIGQITNIEYTFYGIDLTALPDGHFSFELVREKDDISVLSKDFDITIPKPILTWELKNIAKGKNPGDLIYASNKSGNWQIYKYSSVKKEEKQLTDRHSDVVIENLNTLGYVSNNANIPSPIYNEEQDIILYAIGYDIYKVNDDGSRNIRMSLNMEDGRSPNGLKIFEKNPILTKSGFKVLYQEIFEPSSSELYVAPLSDLNKKTPVVLPDTGNINYFSFGKDENEFVVCLYNRKNSQMNGYYDIWVINKEKHDLDSQRKLETYGYKINSIDIAPNKKFLIFSQNLHSSDTNMQNDLYYINLNNTELKRISPNDNIEDINPVISPDSSKVAYMSSTDSRLYNLYVMDINGENRKQLTEIYITDKPFWLNNYEIVVVDSFSNILKINIETGEFETLVDGFDKINEEELLNELNKNKVYSIE